MDAKKIVELHQMATNYAREEMFQMSEERKNVMKNRDAYLLESENKTGMSSEQIIALQKVGEKYTREYMFKMLAERGHIIDEALREIEERELENDLGWDEDFDDSKIGSSIYDDLPKVKVK